MSKRDLFVVVADLDAENVMKALLCHRQPSLGIKVDFKPVPPPHGDLLRYAGRDSGCYKRAVEVLRTPQRTHRHAMLCFDRHGCGAEHQSREQIERHLENKLETSGWDSGTVAVVVIEPELEAWIWSTSPHVAQSLGWQDDRSGLRRFLRNRRVWAEATPKPADPKSALRQSLRAKNKPGGARLFHSLAVNVGLDTCRDAAFQKLRNTLLRWFGGNQHQPGTIQQP